MSEPVLIDQANLSLAWAKAFLAVRAAPGHRISPLMLSFRGFQNGEVIEETAVRSALDAAMDGAAMQKVQTVANTIFPQALWRAAKGDRAAFYAAYRENLPEYVAMEPRKNRRGLYFGRLIAFGLDHKTGERLAQFPEGILPEDGNQLEVIIQRCKKGVQAMKLQASLFDPGRDHVAEARVGFPCLQHITFLPCFATTSLVMHAFYATQQLFERGYGNYLGLARLGMFVASQVALPLDRVTCFVGVEKMESNSTAGTHMEALVNACERALATSTVGSAG